MIHYLYYGIHHNMTVIFNSFCFHNSMLFRCCLGYRSLDEGWLSDDSDVLDEFSLLRIKRRAIGSQDIMKPLIRNRVTLF